MSQALFGGEQLGSTSIHNFIVFPTSWENIFLNLGNLTATMTDERKTHPTEPHMNETTYIVREHKFPVISLSVPGGDMLSNLSFLECLCLSFIKVIQTRIVKE